MNAHNNSNGYLSYSTESHRVQFLDRYCFQYILMIFPKVYDKFSPILFADDTSFIIANCDANEFNFKTNEMFN